MSETIKKDEPAGISRKIYLQLSGPQEEDSRSDQRRILDALKERGYEVRLTLPVLQKLYPVCEEQEYAVTLSLAWNGEGWEGVDLEAGDTTGQHYGLAADLGSTTVVLRLFRCSDGVILGEESAYNRQIAYGTDILNRIFACRNHPEILADIHRKTLETFQELLTALKKKTGIAPEECISMTVAGNTTMMHFFLGMDPFCVFSAPYAVRADQPGFLRAGDLGLPLKGYVFCFPAKSNYLGGDILSGMIACELYRSQEIGVFFDIGTNGELVVGNRDFLLCGAGAAGPALEGGVVKTGMRATTGAVDQVKIQGEEILCHVMGEGTPAGICGSGIIDLVAELFLAGWVDLRGRLQPEVSPRIDRDPESGELRVAYAENLYFYQSDVDEFLRTKAAAYTMVAYMLQESGISMEDVLVFYAAGAFGKHVSVESAVTIGMYPDIDRKKLICAGNLSLEGAGKLLLSLDKWKDLNEILEKMVYIQFGQVSQFLTMMQAAQAIPHTDLRAFPSVMHKLQERKKVTVHG